VPEDLARIHEFRNQQGKLLVSASPPDTGLSTYLLQKSGQ